MSLVEFESQRSGQGFDVRVARSEEAREAALHIRYKAYLSVGYIEPSAEETYIDAADAYASSIPFAAFDGEKCVGSMRICHSRGVNDRSKLPCSHYYPDVMTDRTRTSMIEVSRVAIDPDIANTSYRATLYGSLVRSALMAASALQAQTILIACKADWVPFYKMMLGAAPVGQPALYPPGDIPITLLAIETSAARRKQISRNTFFAFSTEDVERLRRSIQSHVPALSLSREH